MASKKLKAAYILFLASFLVWLSVFFSVCFPSGAWSTPIKFPNSSLFMLFFGSAMVATVSCLAIGLDYIRHDFMLKHRPKAVSQTSKLLGALQPSQRAGAVRIKENELSVSADEAGKTNILAFPLLEEEQETQ
jgi:hypothetical protein